MGWVTKMVNQSTPVVEISEDINKKIFILHSSSPGKGWTEDKLGHLWVDLLIR